MRTTLTTMNQKMLYNLNQLTTALSRVNDQIASGLQMSLPSDNPVNLVSALGLRSTLAEIKQYGTNLVYGSAVIDASDQALEQMKTGLTRARVLALSGINGSTSIENRASMAQEVSNIFDEAVTLANTRVDGKYIFGGYRTSGYDEIEPNPFVADQADGYRVSGQYPPSLDATAGTAYSLADGDLKINGISIGPSDVAGYDDYSTAFASSSAEAKAKAINDKSDQTGVTAVILPVAHTADGAVQGGTLGSGDLYLNGVDIFDSLTAISADDSDRQLVDAINAKEGESGIAATIDSNGKILLTTVNTPTTSGEEGGIGRNLQIVTSANGEFITHLGGGGIDSQDPIADGKVYFGALQLRSSHKFVVESTSGTDVPGLVALGLDGGTLKTGEPDDVAGDGKLSVRGIMSQTGNVRYAGDRENDLAVKIGKRSTLDISMNGQSAVMDTGIFTALKGLENYLKGQGFTSLHSVNQATDTTATLDSGDTGLDKADELLSGAFTVTVTDNATDPPKDLAFRIGVDPAADNLIDVALKINRVPGVSAQWDSDGHLQVKVDDPSRYTVSLTDDTSNFLDVVGARPEDVQTQALGMSLDAIDSAMQGLSNNISDFGARANRITVQNQIYDNLELSTSDNLSKAQDTDLVEATMELTSKQTAYQAALSAAARTMQLSLVNFL